MSLPELGSTVVSHLRDAFYVTVGLGVIGVTNLQTNLRTLAGRAD